jgi:hypothetical protein
MNERIKELLTGARLFCYDDGTVSLLGETYVSQAEIQKFAELIVRECIMVCWPGGESDVLYEQASAIDKAFIDGQDACVERLKQHFGVE